MVLETSAKIARLLVVSHDAAVLEAVRSAASAHCWQADVAADVWEALERVYSRRALDLLVLDLANDPANCAQVSKILSRVRPELPLVLIDRSVELDRGLDGTRMNAGACLSRPVQARELEAAIRHSLLATADSVEMEMSSDDVEPVGDGAYFIGISPVMRKLRARVALLAETDAPVLLVGEAGSGRETIARLLHKLSIRSGFGFARVNCAALPEELLDRAIFGGGADLSADRAVAKDAKVDTCDRGTIFLDEIAEMPLRLQEKLVKLIRDQRVARARATARPAIDIRLVAASTRSLDQAIAEQRMLVELARELSDWQVRVPALRERREELPILSRHFMHHLARRYSLPSREMTRSVYESWQAHAWPGNLRELEEAVKRYMLTGERGPSLGELSRGQSTEGRTAPANGAGNGLRKRAAVFPSNLNQASLSQTGRGQSNKGQPNGGAGVHRSLRSLLRSVKEEAERSAIASALEETGWNRKAAARLLKTSYRTVLYKIEQYQMTASDPSLVSNGGSLVEKESTRRDMNAREYN
jgi:two-component system, NtrC family, response regulator AtoC